MLAYLTQYLQRKHTPSRLPTIREWKVDPVDEWGVEILLDEWEVAVAWVLV